MTATLSVNLNAVALLRNRRDLPWPNVTHLGRIALQAGAAGLTVHPRPDQRHTRFADLPELRKLIDTEFPKAEFNIEGYPTEEFIDLCLRNRPEQVTLVPDDPAQATSDHGWDFLRHGEGLARVIALFKAEDMRVSLFADADAGAMAAAKATGADRVEFYTGPYAAYHNDSASAAKQLQMLAEAAQEADRLGLGINAGHDLTVANIPALVRAVPQLLEVSIGHGLTADALEFGMAGSVRRFIAALQG
ncbi:pyridoxine 5'-phosphate synthase [Limoniibacter endophyticus]|uniref:Pyridoxine 5'-phosphate synthase n=1 Tax=Limoniibacter endophyticus TaxID=1565040 RepID=A0A8J3DRK7_9HYPH|nr:pyridoxine 5'-phosphate synthase [Limoniibacter endophyticus]GHC75411.1 pyridoxine 5'-phosphate synthase [Limoniibacter endophyticus]